MNPLKWMTWSEKIMFKDKLAKIRLAIFDFDGVFTDNKVLVSEDGTESVTCCRSDGIGISRIATIGVKSYVVSSETNPVVKVRCQKLGLPVIQGVENKQETIKNLCKSLKVTSEECLFLGNDINDINALKMVGCPLAVADSYAEIDPYVIYKTKNKGGEGAVREICDLIYNYKII